MKLFSLKLLAVFTLILLLLPPAHPARADAAAPPRRIYLRFLYADGSTPHIEGLQLAGCEESSCLSPFLLSEWGYCTQAGCLPAAPAIKGLVFECSMNVCYLEYMLWGGDLIPSYIQVILQSSEQNWKSAPIQLQNTPLYKTAKWKVIIEADTLTIVDDPDFPFLDFPYRRFFDRYLFTIIVELFLAGAGIWTWGDKFKIPKIRFLASVLLANILSYLVAWLLIPSLGQFQYDSTRKTGVIVAIGTGYFTLVAIGLFYRKPDPLKQPGAFKWLANPPVQTNKVELLPRAPMNGQFWKGTRLRQPLQLPALPPVLRNNCGIILIIISIPACTLFMLVWMAISSYSNYQVHVYGLPPYLIIPTVEGYVFLFETWLIYTLGKKAVTLQQAAIFSLLANASSYILGQIIF